jgi:HTH-type transcriptional regulator, competence development regulator
MTEFGTALKKLRKERRITQRDLADRVGVDFTYISKMENGKLENYPSLDTIINIANALEVNSDDLILLANKIPESMREAIVDNELAVAFLRKVGHLTTDQRRQIKDLLEKG